MVASKKNSQDSPAGNGRCLLHVLCLGRLCLGSRPLHARVLLVAHVRNAAPTCTLDIVSVGSLLLLESVIHLGKLLGLARREGGVGGSELGSVALEVVPHAHHEDALRDTTHQCRITHWRRQSIRSHESAP